MPIKNSNFRVIGVVYSNPKYFNKSGSMCASVTLAIKNNDKTKYLPITAYQENADVLVRLGRNGNLVAISGYLDSVEYFDKKTGVSTIRVYFVMEDMMVIEKMKPTRVTDKRIENLIKTFNLE